MSEDIQPQVETKVQVKRSKVGIFFNLLLLVLIIAVAAGGFFMIEEIRMEHEGIGGEINQDDQELQRLAGQLRDFQNQFTTLEGQLTGVKAEVSNLESESTNKSENIKQTLAEFSGEQSEKLAANKKELLISIEQIKRQLGKTRGDWLIADAEYLLSVANQRLHLLADFHTTIEAMQAADQRLRESGDTGVIKVREQLAKELAVLKAVETIDVVGVYSRIKLLIESADSLILFSPYIGKTPVKQEDLPENLDVSGIGIIDETLERLQGIVSVRRTKQPVKAIISADQAEFIQQQLKAKLQIAVIALVNNNEEIYLSSLADAQAWVTEFFTENTDAERFIDEITELKNVPLHSQLPDISQSLKMLRDISKLRLEADKALFADQLDALEAEAETNMQTTEPVVETTDTGNPDEQEPEVQEQQIQEQETLEPTESEPVQETGSTETEASPADAADQKQ